MGWIFIVSEDYNTDSSHGMDEQYLFKPGQLFQGTSPLLFVVQLGLGDGLQLPLQLHLNNHKAKYTTSELLWTEIEYKSISGLMTAKIRQVTLLGNLRSSRHPPVSLWRTFSRVRTLTSDCSLNSGLMFCCSLYCWNSFWSCLYRDSPSVIWTKENGMILKLGHS